MRAEGSLGFKRVVVAGALVEGRRIVDVDPAGGRDTLLAIPGEGATGEFDCASLGQRNEFARIEVSATSFPFRYRLVAGIVLVEAARQIGRPAVAGQPVRRRGLTYESALEVAAAAGAEVVWPDELRPIDTGAASDSRVLLGFALYRHCSNRGRACSSLCIELGTRSQSSTRARPLSSWPARL
jgi:hypothetical protein